MAKGYAVGIVSETKAFKQGIQSGVIDPLEDAQDELLALGRSRGPDQLERALDDAADTAEDVERRLKDVADEADDLGRTDGPERLEKAMKDAQTATERLGDETEDVARAIERDFRDTYRKVKKEADDVGDSGVRGFGRASEAGAEFKDEALQNFSEVTSSFDGSMSSIQDLAQGTLGGLASSGLPGIGIAAGVAAAGVGLIGAAIEANDEAMKESEQRVADWAQAYIDGSGKIVGAAHVVAEVQGIATDPERYKDAKQAAEDWGVTTSTAMLALAGDETALGVVTESLTKRQEEWGRIVEETSTGSANSWDKSNMTGKQRELGDAVARGTERLKKQRGEMSEGQRVARETAQALYEYTVRTGKATDKTDELGNAIYELPDGTEIVVDAKTKQAYEDIEALEKKAKAKKGTVTFDVNSRAVDNYKPKNKTATVNYVVGKAAGGRQMV